MTAGNSKTGNQEGQVGCAPDLASPPIRVLLAEDDAAMRSMLAWALRAEGHEVVECADGPTACSLLACGEDGSPPFDLFVSDVRMPGMTGFEVLARLREKSEHPPVILITAFGDATAHRTATQLGAAALLSKPFELETLVAKVREVISAKRNHGSSQKAKMDQE